MLKDRKSTGSVFFALVLAALILLAFSLASAGCGRSKAGQEGGTESVVGESEESQAQQEDVGEESEGSAAEEPGFSLEQVTGGTEEVMVLKDIRLGDHPLYERVVVEFTSQEGYPRTGTPRFRARYVKPPYTDAEGHRVDIEGRYLIELRFNGNVADLSLPEGYKLVYQGPESFAPGFSVIREAKLVPAYELNSMILLIGLAREAPFRVEELASPPRIVLDVRK